MRDRLHPPSCATSRSTWVRDVRRMGSCALDLCHVAEGSADDYVEEGPHLWDHAAGSLVAQQAGARFALLPDGRLGRLRDAAHGVWVPAS